MPQPNLNKMLKQVQEMQAEMMKAQEQLKDEIVEASAGGGMVIVKLSGDLELKEIKIDPGTLGDESEALDADDLEMLQDMVLAAVNEAIRSAQELANRKLGGAAGLGGAGGLGGLGLPGL
jgi:nucleoid-associated protein EbfC